MTRTTKTFIGGLVIGTILGAIGMNVLMANWVVNNFGEEVLKIDPSDIVITHFN